MLCYARIPFMENVKSKYDLKLKEQAARRAARYLALHIKGMSDVDIGKRFGISRQRVNFLINKARKDLTYWRPN